jgi:DnaJ domain
MNKPKGGRCKREPYNSSAIRVPDPIRPQVLELIDQFHQSRALKLPSFVKNSIEKIPVRKVTQFYELSYIENLGKKEEQEYIYLANKINLTIWQVDNTFTGLSIKNRSTDVDETVYLLIEYSLIELPVTTKPVTTIEYTEWLFEQKAPLASVEEVTLLAIQTGRLDIVKVLGILNKPPINRKEYWHHYYRTQLGKPKVNYWQWQDNPESKEICPELTLLLNKLPKPNSYTKLVLMHLADGKNRLWEQQKFYQAFLNWHNKAIKEVGRQKLLQVYQVLFNCPWSIIESILQQNQPQSAKLVTSKNQWWQVLAVPKNATKEMVKAAYKKLALQWHPDYNKSPDAEEKMKIINAAMAEYERLHA